MSEKYPKLTSDDEAALRISVIEQIRLNIRFIGEGLDAPATAAKPAQELAGEGEGTEPVSESDTIVSKEIK